MDSPRPPRQAPAVASITEAERAAWLRELGKATTIHRGRHWYEPNPGFWRSVHLLARLSDEEATKPKRACWGFQTSLAEQAVGTANCALPLHWLRTLDALSEQNLSSNRRYQLRKARRLVQFEQLTDAERVVNEGYDVMASSLERTQFERVPDRQDYEHDVRASLRRGRRFVLAGLVGGAVAGYADGFAVDEIAYLDNLYIATKALGTQISIGLQFEFVEACRRSGQVRELVHGMHALYDATLTMYKERIGFPVSALPARLWLLPGCAPLLRRFAPGVYYRWTGRPA